MGFDRICIIKVFIVVLEIFVLKFILLVNVKECFFGLGIKNLNSFGEEVVF